MAGESAGRRVTSADVAREAGVSRATVSYVLNGAVNQRIPAGTRDRVLAAAAHLGYAPSAAARALRAGRSDVVLCLLPDWPIGPTVGEFLNHMSTTLASNGLTFMVHPSGSEARPVAEVWKAITPCAVISFEDLGEATRAAMRAAGVQVVLAMPGSAEGRNQGAPQIYIGRIQVGFLAEAGHRRLGYAYPADERVLGFAQPRLDGVREAAAELGLPEPAVLTVPLDAREAARAVATWRRADLPVTAICAYNDETAFAVLAGMRAHGLAAPGDLAVIGVDDIPTAALSDPPLTTIRVDQRSVATYVVDTIVNTMANRPLPPASGAVSVRVVERESARRLPPTRGR